MNDTQQKAAVKRFAELWKGKGYEKGESQKFWLSVLQDVYGVEHPAEFVTFEEQVHIDKSTGFIDGMIPATRVMIEQKGLGKDLNKPIKQSDGSLLTPFQRAKRYIVEKFATKSGKLKWLHTIISNAQAFVVGTYHGLPKKNLQAYMDEYCYRFSRSKFGADLFDRLTVAKVERPAAELNR